MKIVGSLKRKLTYLILKILFLSINMKYTVFYAGYYHYQDRSDRIYVEGKIEKVVDVVAPNQIPLLAQEAWDAFCVKENRLGWVPTSDSFQLTFVKS
jgi:predicted RNA-binding protein (virulence factor B family)